MAYTPTIWVPGVTPLSALNMNNLETQYQQLVNLFNAQTILIATLDNTPVPLTVGASTIVARLAAGNIVAATPAQILALLSGQAGADFNMNAKRIANVLAPNAAGCVMIKGTRGTLLELPALTTGKVWKGAAGIPAEADAGAVLNLTQTEVFAGQSPDGVWADLDLSGTIGTNAALVVLKIKATAPAALAVRRNGDADEFWGATAESAGCALMYLQSNVFQIVIAVTDTSGVIEWKTTEDRTSTVDLIAYIV